MATKIGKLMAFCKICLGLCKILNRFSQICFFSTCMALVCCQGAGVEVASPTFPVCPLLCPQPCRSLCMPTPALFSGRSMKGTATATSPSTKPGPRPTSTVRSSPLASGQQSWPPFTGESPTVLFLLGKRGHGDCIQFHAETKASLLS